MMTEPICPHCGDTISICENVDENFEINSCEVLVSGVCFSCGQEYQWWEVYNFSHIKGLEEIS